MRDADREYFRLHVEKDTGLLDISKPVVGRTSGVANVLLSRRLNRPDGSFAGVVLVAVSPEYFTAFYQESDLGKRGSTGLLGLDGTLRARRTAAATVRLEVGNDWPHQIRRHEHIAGERGAAVIGIADPQRTDADQPTLCIQQRRAAVLIACGRGE